MFMQVSLLQQALEQRSCKQCACQQVDLHVTSLKGFSWSLESICRNDECRKKNVVKTCSSEFNDAVFTAAIANGLKIRKLGEFFADLNFVAETSTRVCIGLSL